MKRARRNWYGKWESSVLSRTVNGFASDNIFLSSALTIICLLFSPAMFFLQRSLRNLIKINVNRGGWARKTVKVKGEQFLKILALKLRKEATQGHNLTYVNSTEFLLQVTLINRKSSLKFQAFITTSYSWV